MTVTTGPAPDLRDYDVVLVNSSAGKDSQATMDVVVEAARAAGVMDRLVVVHADLGDAEWPGTRELAAEHAAHYGLRFEVVARRHENGSVNTILERVAERGMFPDSQNRWCIVIPLSTERVWVRIGEAGTRSHDAYAQGMTRLSCRFCVLASKRDLICSARLNPELAAHHGARRR